MNTEMDYIALGKAHKEWRIANKIGVSNFAKLLGIKPSQLANFEHGRVDKDGNIRSLTDDELISLLPAFPHTSDGKPISGEQLDSLIKYLREFWKP
ncbi:hypothetical protein LCGC14_0977360 [marine sediment metagenome]|uniref:Uncharacterized protein n=1 Tax=marine sediment metagenome TaxID=412755 RepID=A0A0F9QT74_9ZZZZ